LRDCYQPGRHHAPAQPSNLSRQKTNLQSPVKPFTAVKAVGENKSLSLFRKLMFYLPIPLHHGGALRAIVTTREAGMRWTRGVGSMLRMPTNGASRT